MTVWRNSGMNSSRLKPDPIIEHVIDLENVRRSATGLGAGTRYWTEHEKVILDSTKYMSPTFCLDFVGYGSRGFEILLYDWTVGAIVEASSVTVGTALGRYRSADFSITDGHEYGYVFRLGAGAPASVYCYQARVIVEDEISGGWIRSEEQVEIGKSGSSDYYTHQVYWYYDPSKFSGGLTFYFEGDFRVETGGDTGQMALYNATDKSEVPGSQVQTTSTSYVRVRSEPITLEPNKVYEVSTKTVVGTGRTLMAGAKVVIDQEGSPITKSQLVKTYTICPYFRSTGWARIGVQYLLDKSKQNASGTLDATYWVESYENRHLSAWVESALWNLTDNALVGGTVIHCEESYPADVSKFRVGPVDLPDLKELDWVGRTAEGNDACCHKYRIIVDISSLVALPPSGDFPPEYVSEGKAEDLKPRAPAGATITKVSQDFPLLLRRVGKSKELKSKVE